MARLHEYQGKAILAANGFKIPRGRAASTPASEQHHPSPARAPSRRITSIPDGHFLTLRCQDVCLLRSFVQ